MTFHGKLVWVTLACGICFDEAGLAWAMPERSAAGDGSAGMPRAVWDAREHDFGMMDPLTMGRHSFVVRNRGTQPLRLTQGQTTCKCTLSDVTDKAIAPGASGRVVLEWNTGRRPFFEHAATIHTNDPDNPTVELKVKGTVRIRISSEPEELVFPRVVPDEAVTGELVVFSQHWSTLEIAELDCSVEGATITIEAVDAEQRQRLMAKSAVRLVVQLPANLPEGFFSGTLRFVARDPGVPDASEKFEVPLEGKVLRRLSVYGTQVCPDGSIQLGTFSRADGVDVRLMVKVRDSVQRLDVKQLQVTPEFVEAALVPYKEEAGLYHLTIRIRPGAPEFRARDPAQHRLRIEFVHPRIDVLEMPLEFTVSER